MPIGEIKSYNPNRGFGFLRNGTGEDSDIFFHISNYKDSESQSPPEVGDRVSFVAIVGDKGLAAKDVRKM